MSIGLLKHHFFIKLGEKVTALCKPLFDKTDIDYFLHARLYDDGRFFFLSTHPDWEQYCWEQKYHQHVLKGIKPGISFWHTKTKLQKALHDLRTLFNLDYRMDIVERGENYFDLFGFSAKKDDIQILDYYMNNVGYLKYFIFYFKDCAYDLIQACDRAEEQQLYLKVEQLTPWQPDTKEPSLVLEPSQCVFNTEQGQISLSQKDLICLLQALRQGVSNDTESCLTQVRDKMHCATNLELFDKAWDYGIVHVAMAAS